MSWFYTILSGAVSLVLGAWVWFRISNRRVIRLSRAIPSPQPCYPVLGNLLMFACSQERMTANLMDALQEAVLKGQEAVCFWLGPYPLTFVLHPDHIKRILNTSLSRGREFEEIGKEFIKSGLLFAKVDHWRATRRHLDLTFHPRKLEQLMPIFNSASRQLVADMSEHVDGPVFDIMPHVMSAALKSIFIFLLGQKAMEIITVDQLKDVKHAVEIAAELVAIRLIRPWLQSSLLFSFLRGKDINSIKRARLLFGQLENVEIDEKEEQFHVEEGSGLQEKTEYRFQSVYSAMKRLKEKLPSLTDDQILDEMGSFFGTGTDSIGATVSSCLLALARFPLIQDKVYEEISSVVSDCHVDITDADLNRLTYLEQVLKETLRFFTITPFTTRTPSKDIDLGGYILPANKMILLNLTAAFVNPKYFPDPQTFDPSRFARGNSSDESAFMPFSRGPRNCIGSVYSMMLMKVMVAHVVLKYRLSTSMCIQGGKKKYMITLPFCDGYNISLTERSK